jgi:hypothetical protein
MILHYFLVIIMFILVFCRRYVSLLWLLFLPVSFVRLLSCFLTVNSSHLPLSAQTVSYHKVARLYTVLQVLPPAVLYVDVSNEIRIAALLSLKLAFC